MSKQAIGITGIWVHRAFDHLGGELEIRVEVDGKWRTVQRHGGPEHGYISHITEVRGIANAPLSNHANDEKRGDRDGSTSTG